MKKMTNRKVCGRIIKMSKFDKIIGYDSIKKELLQICDMLKNKAD